MNILLIFLATFFTYSSQVQEKNVEYFIDYIVSTNNDCPEITANDFSELLLSIKSSSSEADKFKHVKLTMRYYCVYAEQLLKIMNYIDSEDLKLDLAKFAYEKTINQNQFNVIYSAFSSRDKVEELIGFIEMRYK